MNIILIDDDKLVCSALKTILESDPEFHVPVMGHDGNEAIALYKEYQPDMLLMDIRMSGMSGIDAGEAILRQFPQARILYLTTFADNEYIVRALKIGAKGYILKQNFESIIPAVRAVISGQSVFGDEIVSRLPSMSWTPVSSLEGFDLTEREIEIIRNVAEGLSNKEIAGLLFLSEGTVRNYISTILEKLNLRDRTQLAIFYYKHQK